MSFDIYAVDDLDDIERAAESAFSAYQDALLDLFFASPEGKRYGEQVDQFGYWAAQLMYYGYWYLDVSLPQMTVGDVETIVEDIFPRKISLADPEEAAETIPELAAFLHFLDREYELPEAGAILRYLRTLDPQDYVDIMNDPANYGMAKSFLMAGTQAGFDMTDQDELNTFMQLYNASLLATDTPALDAASEAGSAPSNVSRQEKSKKKAKRKEAKQARKRNRKKKRK